MLNIKRLNLFIFSLINFSNLTAQSGEITINTQYGLAGSRFRAINNSHDKFSAGQSSTTMTSNWLNDKTIGLNYSIPLIKKWKLFGNFDIEYGKQTKYFYFPYNGIIYDVVNYHSTRTEYQFGIFKRFQLKSSKISFDAGIDLSYRNYTYDVGFTKANEYQPSYPNSSLSYEYFTYNKKLDHIQSSYEPSFLNPELHFKANFPITSKFSISSGIRLAFNYFEFHTMKYRIKQFTTDGNLITTYNIYTQSGSYIRINGNYAYVSLGLKYKFDWKNKKNNKEINQIY